MTCHMTPNETFAANEIRDKFKVIFYLDLAIYAQKLTSKKWSENHMSQIISDKKNIARIANAVQVTIWL